MTGEAVVVGWIPHLLIYYALIPQSHGAQWTPWSLHDCQKHGRWGFTAFMNHYYSGRVAVVPPSRKFPIHRGINWIITEAVPPGSAFYISEKSRAGVLEASRGSRTTVVYQYYNPVTVVCKSWIHHTIRGGVVRRSCSGPFNQSWRSRVEVVSSARYTKYYKSHGAGRLFPTTEVVEATRRSRSAVWLGYKGLNVSIFGVT